MQINRFIAQCLCFVAIIITDIGLSYGFSGVFLAKDGSQVISKQAKIVMARKGNKTVLTMTGDFHSHAQEIILVIPIPGDVQSPKVSNVNIEMIDQLDRYSSPRLIEYIDFDPCNENTMHRPAIQTEQSFTTIDMDRAIGLNVAEAKTIAAKDFVTLSAKESFGLDVWLRQQGYKLSAHHLAIFEPYMMASMKFVIAKFTLTTKITSQFMPIQIIYESDKFVLPLKLGMVNASANTPQDMLLFILSDQGEVLPRNFKTKDMPININLPQSVTSNFDSFYTNLTSKIFAAHPEVMRKEYAWPMSACKPCTSVPPSIADLQLLGAFWYKLPQEGKIGLVPPFAAIYLTRLHTQYSGEAGHRVLPGLLELQASEEKPRFQTFFNIRTAIAADKSVCKSDFAAEMTKANKGELSALAMLVG